MNPQKTALILIGYQNDYFAVDGILHNVVEESSQVTNVLANTVDLIEQLLPTPVLLIATPIIFTPNYEEIVYSVGILKIIKEVGAFQAGTKGAEIVSELLPFKERIIEVSGKRGLNAFSSTQLDLILKQRQITDVVLAGTVTSICIDSTGRAAYESGYRVTILSDCTSARTNFEQNFYCENIFPLYANVISHAQLLNQLKIAT
ncbi:cysteine hydrolase family protein [Aetokthonos hydrillicola Thurmond2011]|jgi:nicotinamidase-related amidase|uniref:Cysteine hydrolase family protein n=1 Tax=Aetokthonos hydrillicola Thurmond2011 TaxID=2712845 RepID=A0AAP5M9Q8_9CYAN|nr:cysteine hydrolase family protein [Aetokthonos hydrillicola]MBO3462496.1 cysteine hydrolase family protein [Aetokthonos hydrillicola CCALA 1050]MBW4588670.1 cysteine hydrolase family protein [Aetokthonos hydrillicola CCALA 1050]MDR9895997.1 cysteine hydrolase family protein [Aetokthonos hydrillicola Thurmond2011]